MADRRPPPAPEALLQHQEFLRALARGLLGDAERAEDAVQDAYAAALAHPPSEAGALRGWLATVVRNGALNQLRAESRRLAREREAARAEVLADDVGERLRTQQRVLAAVEALREPYRTAVYLRYAEGLPPREIAERTGAPVETVRSRIQRGLEVLHRDLDREYGDRSAWSVALFPFATSLRSTRAPLLIAAGVILLLFLPAAVWLARDPHAQRLQGIAPVEPLSARTATTTPLQVGPPMSTRSSTASAIAASQAPDVVNSTPASTRWLHLVDSTGNALRGVNAGASASSDAQGWLEVPVDVEPPSLLFRDAASDEPLRVLELTQREDGPWTAQLDVGLELDVLGDPIQIGAATFLLHAPGDFAVSRSRAHTQEPSFVRFGRVPRVSLLGRGTRSTWLLSAVSADGLQRADVRVHALPGRHATPVAFAFEPATRLVVRVLDATGAPASDCALEADGDIAPRAVRAGTFVLEGLTAERVELVARARGHAPRTESVEVQPRTSRAIDLWLAPRPAFDMHVELVSSSGREAVPGRVRVRADSDSTHWVDAPITATGAGRFVAVLDDLPPGDVEVLPPFDEPWLWDPPRARVSLPGGTVRFVRADHLDPRPILVQARDESGSVPRHVRLGLMVDRGEHGVRETWKTQRNVPLVDVHPGAEMRPGVLPGQRAWWVVEADGCQSTWGDERAFRQRDGLLVLDVVLRPAWHCELAFVQLDSGGTSRPLEGVRLRTSAGLELARSLADGRIVLDALFDPGQIQVDRPGWRVAAWEGFVRGKRRVELPVHRVLMEPD